MINVLNVIGSISEPINEIATKSQSDSWNISTWVIWGVLAVALIVAVIAAISGDAGYDIFLAMFGAVLCAIFLFLIAALISEALDKNEEAPSYLAEQIEKETNLSSVNAKKIADALDENPAGTKVTMYLSSKETLTFVLSRDESKVRVYQSGEPVGTTPSSVPTVEPAPAPETFAPSPEPTAAPSESTVVVESEDATIVLEKE